MLIVVFYCLDRTLTVAGSKLYGTTTLVDCCRPSRDQIFTVPAVCFFCTVNTDHYRCLALRDQNLMVVLLASWSSQTPSLCHYSMITHWQHGKGITGPPSWCHFHHHHHQGCTTMIHCDSLPPAPLRQRRQRGITRPSRYYRRHHPRHHERTLTRHQKTTNKCHSTPIAEQGSRRRHHHPRQAW